jgi:hypothetical protein
MCYNYNNVMKFYKKYDRCIIFISLIMLLIPSLYLSITYKKYFTNCYEFKIPNDSPCKKNILCNNNTICQSSGYCKYKDMYIEDHMVCKCYFSCDDVGEMFLPLFIMTLAIMFILGLIIWFPIIIMSLFCNKNDNNSYNKLNEISD